MAHIKQTASKSTRGKAPRNQLMMTALFSKSVPLLEGEENTSLQAWYHGILANFPSGVRNGSELKTDLPPRGQLFRGKWGLAGWPFWRHRPVCCPCQTPNDYAKDIQPVSREVLHVLKNPLWWKHSFKKRSLLPVIDSSEHQVFLFHGFKRYLNI